MCQLTSPESLRRLLARCGISQRQAATTCAVSPATINILLRKGQTPKTTWPRLREALTGLLRDAGASERDTDSALDDSGPAAAPQTIKEELSMIIRKQHLSMSTRQHFKLLRDPFADPQSVEDVYLSPDSRFVRETMHDAAVNGNFLAVVGESGSGKSTLREELVERLRLNGESVIVVEPYTLSMAESEKNGKPLRAPHIAEAIISTVSPGTSVPPSPEMRARKLHKVLVESSRAGFRHCLVIEEAHDLHMHTLKALKRFWELKDGMRRLLSIILIGQTELKDKLSSTQSDVREVVQRCDVVELPPVKQPGDFLAFRFQRAGSRLEDIFAPDGVEELRNQLVVARGLNAASVYLGYPLAISNFAVASMNLAAELGFETVTADVVRQVHP